MKWTFLAKKYLFIPVFFIPCAFVNATVPNGMYLGVFGGGGSSAHSNIRQAGTAFLPGDPLNVNATGNSNSHSSGIGGAHLGYKWPKHLLGHGGSQWYLIPAVEVEGYYLGTTVKGELLDPTSRIPNHTFDDSFPMNTGVFLANIIFNFKSDNGCRFYPYLAGGVGFSTISISGANSSQINPAEPGINHFNSNTNSSSATFAAQAKAGLGFDVTTHWKFFAEYRYLYLSSSNYTFGSTQYPTHAQTTNWNAHINSMSYNMGALGIDYVF
jgi:opacity protein-like surface antigen